MPNRRGSKKARMSVFYAEPVGMLRPSWEERLLHYARREQIVAWSQERFGGTASRLRERLRGGSRRATLPWSLPLVC